MTYIFDFDGTLVDSISASFKKKDTRARHFVKKLSRSAFILTKTNDTLHKDCESVIVGYML